MANTESKHTTRNSDKRYIFNWKTERIFLYILSITDIAYYSMKTFRQKFVKNIYFPGIIIGILFSFTISLILNFPMWAICILLAFFIITMALTAYSCNCIVITEYKITICNPYFHRCRDYEFKNIVRINFSRPQQSIFIHTADGKKYGHLILLVDYSDWDEIFGIFKSHGIEITTNLVD